MRFPETPPNLAADRSRLGRVGLEVGARARTAAGRFRARSQLRDSTRLHLGCGDNLLPGWTNVDLFGMPGVVAWNLTRRLPVADASVDVIFTEHFIEHISHEAALRFLSDCFRVLKPGGTLRVSTPDLQKLVVEYSAERLNEWQDVGWSPTTPCRLLNEGMRSWGHLFIFDEDELRADLAANGFEEISREGRHSSAHVELRGLERRPDHGDLILEARRPLSG